MPSLNWCFRRQRTAETVSHFMFGSNFTLNSCNFQSAYESQLEKLAESASESNSTVRFEKFSLFHHLSFNLIDNYYPGFWYGIESPE